MMLHRASSAAHIPTTRTASPRGYNMKPDFRDGSYLEERDRNGRIVGRYRVGKLLGRGGFAKCFEVTDTETSLIWAVKVIDRASLQKSKMYAKMQTEISIHRRMKHKNIINFVKTFQDDWNVYIILEKCDNQTLMELSKLRRRFTVAETQHIMMQTISGMEYMHKCNVIHRDLKLGNMMMDKDMNVKIGDFGLAAELAFDGERKRTICGTPNYIAPEILDGHKAGHSFEVDVWSLGVILYTLLVGEPPFQTSDVKTTYNRIRQCRYSFPPNVDLSDQARSLISRMLQSSPEKRPTLETIRTDPFFRHPMPPTTAPMSLFPETQRRARERDARMAAPAPTTAAAPEPLREPLRALQNQQNQLPVAKDTRYAAPTSARDAPRSNPTSPRRSEPLTARPRSNSLPVARPKIGNWCEPHNNVDPAPQPQQTVAAAKPKSPPKPRLEEDDRKHLAVAHDQLEASLCAAPNAEAAKTPSVAAPTAWVTDYADFSAKYGLAYKMSTGHTGVHYNDGTKLVWEPITNKSEYYARVRETIDGVVHSSDQKSAFVMEEFPESLNKKVTLIKYFKSYLSKAKGKKDGVEVVACSPFSGSASTVLLTDPNMTNDMIYVKRWMVTQQAVIFRLSNKTIQVCFFDRTEVILMSELKTVSFTDPSGRRRTMPLSAVSSQSSDVAQRLKYTKDILCKLISAREI